MMGKIEMANVTSITQIAVEGVLLCGRDRGELYLELTDGAANLLGWNGDGPDLRTKIRSRIVHEKKIRWLVITPQKPTKERKGRGTFVRHGRRIRTHVPLKGTVNRFKTTECHAELHPNGELWILMPIYVTERPSEYLKPLPTKSKSLLDDVLDYPPDNKQALFEDAIRKACPKLSYTTVKKAAHACVMAEEGD